MDDMHPFERQVAAEVVREMRPSRPVDAVAVIAAVDAVRPPRWRFQTMFSAAKFIVAGAIVALFGSFLLAGVLTQQPSDDRLPAVGASASATTQAEPTDAATSEPEQTTTVETATRSDLLPGVDLVTEEVEPGVFRVVSDGQRDLSMPVSFNQMGGVAENRVVRAPDGGVWIFGPDEFLRLGDVKAHSETAAYWGDLLDVDGDGRVWALGGSSLDTDAPRTDGCTNYGLPHLMMFDGTTWTATVCDVLDFELDPDGSPWVVTQVIDDDVSVYGGRYGIGRVSDRDWEEVNSGGLQDWRRIPLEGFHGFAMMPPTTPDEKAWLIDAAGRLDDLDLYADGGTAMGGSPVEGEAVAVGFGSDGTSWAYLRFEDGSVAGSTLRTKVTYLLARFAPEGADMDRAFKLVGVYESELDPGRLLYTCCGIAPRLDVAPDGSLWLPSEEGLGLARFDGETWDWYLEGRFIEDIDIAPDGTVWVVANDLATGPQDPGYPPPQRPAEPEREPAGTSTIYVITPDAVAGAG